MQRDSKHKIDKSPLLCGGPDELLAGDILIFNHNPAARHLDSGGFMTLHNQGFLNERGGHRTSVHSGFIINTPDGKKLAHVVGKGLKVEALDIGFLKRTVHVYRPRKHREQLAHALSELVEEHFQDVQVHEDTATEDELDNADMLLEPLDVRREKINRFTRKVKKFKWDASVAVRSLIHRIFTSIMIVNHDPDTMEAGMDEHLPDNVISRNTICSKFVADSYISACNRVSNKASSSALQNDNHQQKKLNYGSYYMNISSLTPPKALQAYLYRNTNYDYLVMPHARTKLYDELRVVLRKEIRRLKAGVLVAERNKGNRLERALLEFEQAPVLDDIMQQSIAMLKAVTPVLKHNTGGGFVTPSSYKRVMAFAKSEGIYCDYIDHELHDKRDGKKYRELVQTYYHFNSAMAQLYRGFRRKGYSDEEAKFECKPTFGDWYKLCRARNIFLTCTIIGFFAGVLPYGLSRAHQAKKRNAVKEIEASNRMTMTAH